MKDKPHTGRIYLQYIELNNKMTEYTHFLKQAEGFNRHITKEDIYKWIISS